MADVRIAPGELGALLAMVGQGKINSTTAKTVLAEMYSSGKTASGIIEAHGFGQISDEALITGMVSRVLAQYPAEVASYLGGKETVAQWLFGQVMRQAKGQANPQLVQAELGRQLKALQD